MKGRQEQVSRSREYATHWLRRLGLYEVARRLWNGQPDVGATFRNAGHRLAGAPDQLPIPPKHLIELAILSNDVAWFIRSGRFGFESIVRTLWRNGLSPEDFESVLDFGCGCGRILRHWHSAEGPRLQGTDYNQEMIGWCRRHLGHLADFRVNDLEPPLSYSDEHFDFIYAVSVFTHLPEELQAAWMSELERLLEPGGFLLVTVHGDSRLHQLNSEEQAQFRDGELVIRHEWAAGRNDCGAYHPEAYVRDSLARDFEVVDFVARGSRDTDQDAYLLAKPAEKRTTATNARQ